MFIIQPSPQETVELWLLGEAAQGPTYTYSWASAFFSNNPDIRPRRSPDAAARHRTGLSAGAFNRAGSFTGLDAIPTNKPARSLATRSEQQGFADLPPARVSRNAHVDEHYCQRNQGKER